MFKDTSAADINTVMLHAAEAAKVYRRMPLSSRKNLLYAIAEGLEKKASELAAIATKETHLPDGRLRNEIARTALQLRQYGDVAARGDWMEVRINTAGVQNVTTDIRKMQIPLGPVVVFGSSNFPFAYSTAGGDTACALAAGCPVIVKAHPGHAGTSQMVADIISNAVKENSFPPGVFSHVHGISFEVGELLVKHEFTAAVGFTGSLAGGRQLYDWAAQRKAPIPVFSEMGSTNPVFILSKNLQAEAPDLARQYASSITNNAGQFCTKPGLIFGVAGASLERFIEDLAGEIRKVAPQEMLHQGIAKAYRENREKALADPGVTVVAETSVKSEIKEGHPFLAVTPAEAFIRNRQLHREVFGPYSLIIKCADATEMSRAVETIDGQLTATLICNEKDAGNNSDLIDAIRERCGRIIMNGVPTGVAVCRAMNHGGPYPATTDSRFTSVGADGIRRFARPICYQNFPDSLLPDELKNSNPLKIWRTVNDELTRDAVIG